MTGASEYRYQDGDATHSGAYVDEHVLGILSTLRADGARRVVDLGCGNGYLAKQMAQQGFEVVGIDSSPSGIDFARREPSAVTFEIASIYDDIVARHGQFDVVVSTEVIEHLYDPRSFAARAWAALAPGGTLILSTPYHGYLKNLALAITGKLDDHFTALWDHGHIKFFSEPTIRELLTQAGFDDIRVRRIGRIPPLAKTMLVTATKPAS